MKEAPGAQALSIDRLPFVESGPPVCAAFSRATLSGKKVEFSGTEPFNGVILPLVKALDHTFQLYKPLERPNRLFPKLVLCLAVLDAPMILVESPERSSDPVLSPWVRIVRQEARPHSERRGPSRFYGVDAIHVDYFDEVLHKHLMPAAEEFASRAVQLAEVLFQGGEVPSLDGWNWGQVQKKSSG
jgi:hypothetical protein